MAEVPYETEDPLSYEWTDRAFAEVAAGRLQVRLVRAAGVRTALVDGPCPRCGHPVHWSMALDAVAGADGVLGAGQTLARRSVPLDVTCGCGLTHPGAPAGVKGCGIVFRVELAVHRDE